MSSIATLLAHQGGWDEILMVAGPLLVIVALLHLARRRQQRPNDDIASADRNAAD